MNDASSSAPPPATPNASAEAPAASRTLWQRWHHLPLYLRILIGVTLGLVTGLILGPKAGFLAIPSRLVLQLLGALASPLILLAVVQTLMHAEIPARQGGRLVWLLVLNTTVAICIGLFVANVVRPGSWSGAAPKAEKVKEIEKSPLEQFLENVPKSMLGPFTDEGKVIAVIIVALAFGIALRRLKGQPGMASVVDVISILSQALIVMLYWLIEIIPLAIFCVVASLIGTKGFGEFQALGGFVLAVVLALLLQTAYYLVRIRLGSWVRPLDVLRGTRDALVMAFSTASSTATMPVTYSCLRTKVGLREQSASLGSLVGSNFNNDGTALYEAMAALFVSQLVGVHLTLQQQLLVILTSIVASVGAAGIPEAGLVTMTLVFDAVGLKDHKQYIGVLLAIDWFLDRCRTAINVMGDVNVSCLLDGKEREPTPVVEPGLAVLTE